MPIHPPLEMLQLMCSLEVSLHSSTVRGDKAALAHILHADFVEIDRSGQRTTKAQMLAHLLSQSTHPVVWSQGFELAMPSYSVALLSYQSAHVAQHGALAQHAQRSSLWQFADDSWQLRFHQATACTPFSKTETASAPVLQYQAH
jgi:hypothetical protein